jgi:hypothetical protein
MCADFANARADDVLSNYHNSVIRLLLDKHNTAGMHTL